jgi:small subunit ribosomal protein S15
MHNGIYLYLCLENGRMPIKRTVMVKSFVFPKKIVPLRPFLVLIIQVLLLMYLTAEKKQEFFGQYGKSVQDTGSAEGQVALFSYRINHLTGHLKTHKKDHSTERALVSLVGKRRRLLDYLKKQDIERYRTIIKSLELRK